MILLKIGTEHILKTFIDSQVSEGTRCHNRFKEVVIFSF